MSNKAIIRSLIILLIIVSSGTIYSAIHYDLRDAPFSRYLGRQILNECRREFPGCFDSSRNYPTPHSNSCPHKCRDVINYDEALSLYVKVYGERATGLALDKCYDYQADKRLCSFDEFERTTRDYYHEINKRKNR